MGNCLRNQSSKSTAEIAPYDFIKSTSTTVTLYGNPNSPITFYIRFALLHKTLSVHFVPTGSNPVIQIGSHTVSGRPEVMIRFIEGRFSGPSLVVKRGDEMWFCETTPFIVKAVVLHHRSIKWHLDRMVRWAEDLATRGGRKTVNPAMGSPRMEIRKFANSYSMLLEVMLEHAQMEERVVFSILESADRGLCKAANEEHARDLPIMNGIKEDIKSIGVLDTNHPDFRHALLNLSSRLKSLLEHCKQHFEEEERDVLPLMEAVELSKEQRLGALEQCFDMMQATHLHLFKFLIEGLLPWEALQYLDLLILSCKDENHTATMIRGILE